MHWESHGGNTAWPDGIARQHQVVWDLDISLEGLFQETKKTQIQVALATRSKDIRRTLIELFLTRVIPHIFEATNNEYNPSTFGYSYNSDLDNTWSISHSKGQPPSIRSKIHLVMNIETEEAVTSYQAAYSCRSAIVADLAGTFMHSFNEKYLGSKKSSSSEKFTTRNGIITGCEIREGNEPPILN